MSEVADRLSEQHRVEGARLLKQASQFTSYLIYGLMCLMLVFAIFTIAGNVFGAYNNAMK